MLRAPGRALALLFIDLLQRIQNAAAGRRGDRRRAAGLGLRCRWGTEDRARLAIGACHPGQHHAGHEEKSGQNGRRPRQQIGSAAARHEAGAAAHAETAAVGFLQQYGADQHGDNHEVNDDNDGLHLETFRHKPRAPDFGCTIGLAGFPEVARCYTIGQGVVTPNRCPGDNRRGLGDKSVPRVRFAHIRT